MIEDNVMPGLRSSLRVDDTPRVMWILNHTAARKFELPMLQKLGYEIFAPKSYPNNPGFRSASVDGKWDQTLSIPKADLDLLNSADWYRGASNEAWRIANKYFDLLFCIVFDARSTEKTCRNFDGDILWRAYGLARDTGTYSHVVNLPEYSRAHYAFKQRGARFWFGEAYPHLHEVEDNWIKKRAVYLPLGMAGASEPANQPWAGGDRRILFVCPDIGSNYVYAEIYQEFKKHLGDLPYAIGGTQSVKLHDPNILGYLPLEKHIENMAKMQCMFYHSREPRHIHYHPFEAIKVGMPLVFMSDGMLDRMGGIKLPGRAKTWREAKAKLERILDGDTQFIQEITASQSVLLEEMKAENLEHYWVDGLAQIKAARDQRHVNKNAKQLKLAILSSVDDEADARALAHHLLQGSSGAGVRVDVVLGVETSESDQGDAPLPKPDAPEFSHRDFSWRSLSKAAAQRAMFYARSGREIVSETYVAPDDQINYFQDCDAWVIVGGRAKVPVLPLKPLIWFFTDDSRKPIAHSKTSCRPVGRLGVPPHPEAVIVKTAEIKSMIVNMEALDPEDVYIVDINEENGGAVLNVVLECV